MRHTTGTIRILGICALVTVAGCFKLARPTTPLSEYVLGSGKVATRVAPPQNGDPVGLTIGVRRVDLASYLATPAIVVRHGARIVTSEFHRWGEDPSDGVTRAVSEYLAAAAPVFAVDVAPWQARARHDYVVQIHISRLEGVAPEAPPATDGELHVLASWEVFRPQDGALLARGESDRSTGAWKVGDYRGLVILIETGLDRLAGDVAACLARLSPAMPPPDSAAVAKTVVCGGK